MTIARIALLFASLLFCSISWGQLPTAQPNIEILRGIVYRTVNSTALALDIYRPDGGEAPVPVVLVIHGGSWTMGRRDDFRPYYEQLASMGYAVVPIDYRLAPRYIFPAQLEDARAAIDWVRTHAEVYHFDLQRFFVIGASAGGQLAGLLGTQPETSKLFAGVITLAAPMDFTVKPPSLQAKIVVQMYLGEEQDRRPDVYAAASPITYVSPDDPPFLIMHGEDDLYVPPSQATSMTEALRRNGVPVQLVLLPDLGHEVPRITSRTGIAMMTVLRNFLVNPKSAAGTEKTPVT